MIGFSIMMWFVSAILIFVSIFLLKGNYSFVHGKVFDTTDNKKRYAKELGKPVLFVGIGVLVSGIIAIIVKNHSIAFCRVQRTPMRFRADAVQSTTDALKQCIFSYSRGFITTV